MIVRCKKPVVSKISFISCNASSLYLLTLDIFAERAYIVSRSNFSRCLLHLLHPAILSQRRGFSLPESLIALLILSIAIIALAALPLMVTKLALSEIERKQAVSSALQGLDLLESLAREESVASKDVVRGRFRVDYFKSPANSESGGGAIVNVRWNGLSGRGFLELTRCLSNLACDSRPRAFGGASQ
ncbi:MAG: prepilin-type N-terminal cleavage/methylation domain-containing protein [Verrucomicrobiae bacterium]|nr:prepilin-type N-terminal cleavage/methylation domain-containing protein [Verrucomicrobiae bacterium]